MAQVTARRWLLPCLLALPLTAGGAPAPIIISAPRLAMPLGDFPAAVDVIETPAATQARQGLQLDEALNRVPGVFAQNRYNFAQDVRLSIRGFGARAPFGVRGLRILQDGIPETTPDGQSQVDAIDLLNIRSIEILRGPGAALYGNASGGVVAITTRNGSAARGHGGGLLAGSYGFRRLEAVSEAQGDAARYSLTAHALRLDGYRDQARAEKRLLRLHSQHDLDAGVLSLHLRYLDAPLTEDPGALTRAELAADRRAAAPLAQFLDSRQRAEQLTAGAQWRRPAGAGELRLGGFVTQRDYRQQLPFFGSSQVAYARDFYGLSLGYQRYLGPTRLLFGVDLERQRDDRTRHCINAALEASCAAPGEPVSGPLALDQRETAQSRGVFVQSDTRLGGGWNLAAGLRHDRIRFTLDDHLQSGAEDLSGAREFDETSASAGLIWQWRPGQRAFINAATAFETPTFTEFANPAGSGGFNPDLQPQQTRSVEVGLRGDAAGLGYDLTAHVTRVRDELVPYELPGDGRTYYRNAGHTLRRGLEAGLDWRPAPPWNLRAALTLNDFRYREFNALDGESLDGKRLPGLPQRQVFLEAAWRPGDVFVIADLLYVGARYADDANTERVAAHSVMNLRAGRQWRAGPLHGEAFVALNNILDRAYIDNLRINAGFGRYFEAAPERNLLLGLRLFYRP